MHHSFEHHSASRLSEPPYCRQSARVILHLHKGRIQLSPRPSSRLLVFRPPFIEADTKFPVIPGPLTVWRFGCPSTSYRRHPVMHGRVCKSYQTTCYSVVG
jgi:hypothetical protein